jgi:hypothetical protein
MRLLLRMLVLVLASYGALAPAVLALVLATPLLIAFVDWPTWLKALLLVNDVGLLVGTAAWLGPGMLDELRRWRELEQ